MQQRINYIDRLKGLAMLCVIIGHVYLFDYVQDKELAFRIVYSFHVPLFMLVSGYLSYKKDGIEFKSLLLTLRRFLIPMTAVGLLFTLSQNSICSFFDLLHIVKDFFLDPAKKGYWYLMSIAVFYVSIYLLRINKNGNKFIEGSICILLYVLFSLGRRWVMYSNNMSNDFFCLFSCAENYPFFMLGYFANKYSLNKYLEQRNWIYVASLLGYIVFFCWNFENHVLNLISERFIVRFFALVFIVKIFMSRENKDTVVDRVLGYCGKKTLYIYIFHYFIVSNLHLSEFASSMLETNNQLLLFVLSIIITFFATCFSIFVGEIISSNRISRETILGISK